MYLQNVNYEMVKLLCSHYKEDKKNLVIYLKGN